MLIGISISNTSLATENSIKKYYNINLEYSYIPKNLEKLLEEWKKNALNKTIPPDVNQNYFNYLLMQDKESLKVILESEGCYDYEIKIDLDKEKHQANFIINIGQIYNFTQPEIIVNSVPYNEEINFKISLPPVNKLKVSKGKKASAFLVISDENFINDWIEKNNCFFSYRVIHKAIVNHINQEVTIIYDITHDENTVFGDISFSNLSSIKQSYLMKLLTIESGECFKNSSINNSILSLRKSNLLDKIKVILPESPNLNGSVPVIFSVSEKAQRTIKLGTSYSTDIGPGFNIGWEHRNLLSEGETLSTNLYIAEIKKELSVDFEKPFFLRNDQTLKISGSIKEEDNDAYESKGISITESIEKKLKNNWVVGSGVGYNYESVTENNLEDNFLLISAPLYANKNKKDNLLDAQNGWTLNFNLTPEIDALDTSIIFIKNYFDGTYYVPIVENKLTLAFKTGLGSIIGSPSEDIPATERFYAGGAGSIRGYGYQLVGPLNNENDPLGGSSFLELSTEVRIKIFDEYGVVPFIDCGTAFSSRFMNSGESLLCGAGMGFRYYTSFGPLRVDFAVPLEKRSGIDDAFQLYFSIGQSF